MKQKLFTLFLALIASVGTTFAARDVVPSDAVLKNYYKTGQLCVCIFVPAELDCSQVVFPGTYNRDANDGWITDVKTLAKFEPVEGYDGWYVLAVNDETPADFQSGKGIQGKPVVLDQDGNFNWAYQVGDVTVIRGGVTVVAGGFSGEIDLVGYTKDAPNVFIINALKANANPCTAVYHNYTITVISDGCDGSAVPYLIGDMTYWEFQQMQLNEAKTQELGVPVYYYNFKCAEGKRYQVLSGLKGADGAIIEQPSWDKDSYLLQLVDDLWFRYTENGNVDLTTGANVNITFDVRQKNLCWARCTSEDSYTIFGTCGDNLTWRLSNNGTLTISGTGAMADYHYYDPRAPWHNYRSSIKSVIINDGVTSIGEEAFSDCDSLTSITIPNSVTSIGEYAFSDCDSLTSITIGNSVTSIGDGAFYGCSNITSVTWNAKNCNSCNFGSQVTSFEFGKEVEVIPSSLCKGMEKLTSITIPNTVTSIGSSAFEDCSSLTSITIPNSVTSIGNYAFKSCSSLTSVTIPNSVTSIGEDAFSDCSLNSVTLTAPSEEDFCKGQGNSLLYSAGVYCHREIQINGNKVTDFTIPNSVTRIRELAFYGCTSLTSVTIPNSVTSIGWGAFAFCYSLTSITIPNRLTSIGNEAFYDCTSLSSVYIESETPPIIGMYLFHDFYGKQLDVTIYIPCGTIEAYKSAWSEYASRIKYKSLPITIETKVNNEVAGKVVAPKNMCDEMIVTAIPNRGYKFTKWSDGNTDNPRSFVLQDGLSFTANFDYALSGKCGKDNALTWTFDPTTMSLDISGTGELTENYTYGTFIETLSIGNSVTSIGNRAFDGCSSLTSVTIPNSVTSIGGNAFEGCSRLTSVTIPNSVTSIGYDAFNGCNKLVDVYCYATTPPVTENESTFSHYNAFLYVPCESKKAYMVDAVWGNFKYIECISTDNVTTDEIVVTPSENEANVIWPSVNGAASYELVIKDKDGNIVCTLIFNANGQLTSIAFNAPSRNGVPAQTQSAGFSFTITGLDSGTGYDLTLTAKDNSGNAIQTETISFVTTGGNISTDMDQVQSDEVQSTKVVKDGQVLILRNGKTYTMQGQEVK